MSTKNKTIPIRISGELHEKLTASADGAGITMAQFIRQACESALEKKCKRCKGSGQEPAK